MFLPFSSIKNTAVASKGLYETGNPEKSTTGRETLVHTEYKGALQDQPQYIR